MQNQTHLLSIQRTSTLNQTVENEDFDFLPYTSPLASHAGSVNTTSYPVLGE